MKIAEQLRLQFVKRWAILPTVMPQSVAEHSFNVVLITMELMKTGYTVAEVSAAIHYAILHDMAEIYTGDIPSNFKQKLVANGTKLNAKVDELFPETATEVAPEILAIVKVADTLEAINFYRQFGAGNMQEQVLMNMGERLHGMVMKLPDMVATRVATLIDEITAPTYRM